MLAEYNCKPFGTRSYDQYVGRVGDTSNDHLNSYLNLDLTRSSVISVVSLVVLKKRLCCVAQDG